MNRIHCVDRLDPSDNLLDFVRLEMPDEVPPDLFSRELAAFSLKLLNVVLAKIEHSGVHRFTNLVSAERLCYGNQCDLMSAPAAARTRCGDAHAHFIQIFGYQCDLMSAPAAAR